MTALNAGITPDIDLEQCRNTSTQLAIDQEEQALARDLFQHKKEGEVTGGMLYGREGQRMSMAARRLEEAESEEDCLLATAYQRFVKLPI